MIYELVCRIIYGMTMEQTFIVTGIVILVMGISLGFLGEWFFRKENERKEK